MIDKDSACLPDAQHLNRQGLKLFLIQRVSTFLEKTDFFFKKTKTIKLVVV
jgi:hypothetical protein